MSSIAPTTSHTKHPVRSSPWFWLGMVGIFLLSLALRLWGLSRFNTLVFDEVYYAKFASSFLKGETVFTGHPPLSTYIIAVGIWIGQHLPWGNGGLKNDLAGLLLSPFSYRWLNAVTGAFLPLLVGAIAYQLSNRRSYAFIAALLLAADGLFLVESRYALNNVYLLLFGLLGQFCFLLGLRTQRLQRWLWLAVAGVGFGAAVAIKWNGLGFLLGAYLVWIAGWILYGVQAVLTRSPRPTQTVPLRTPLQNLTQLHVGHVLVNFALIPALTYYLCWIPYMLVDPSNDSFWELQLKTLDYHLRVGGLTAHPYCSLWYTWPLMLRPIAYYYKTAQSLSDLESVTGPPLPPGSSGVIYDVHAMGNPILWWSTTVALLLVVGVLLHQIWEWVRTSIRLARQNRGVEALPLRASSWIVLYLVVNWIANLLPWLKVSRCVFLYHYMESFVFALLALALLLDRWLQSPQRWRKVTSLTLISAILLGFVFWMPLYLGLPISPEQIQLRRWFPSWI